MHYWQELDEIPPDWPGGAVTVGAFDGLHRGHLAVLGCTVRAARESSRSATMLTFWPHPARTLRPTAVPAQLTTAPYRRELAAAAEIDAFCELPFTCTLASLSPAAFVREVLVERLRARHVVVGQNFRFGRHASGDLPELRRLGDRFDFAVTAVPIRQLGIVRLSASYVRSCLARGEIELAAAALGRPYRLDGLLVRADDADGPLLLAPASAAIPPAGDYAGCLVLLDDTGQTVEGHAPPVMASVRAGVWAGGTAVPVLLHTSATGLSAGQRVGVTFERRVS